MLGLGEIGVTRRPVESPSFSARIDSYLIKSAEREPASPASPRMEVEEKCDTRSTCWWFVLEVGMAQVWCNDMYPYRVLYDDCCLDLETSSIL